MSRSKKKMAVLHDLQCKQADVILTKKDCGLIREALLRTYAYEDIEDLFGVFNNLYTN